MNIPKDWGKNTGTESRRTFDEKLANGFFDKYMQGNGLDIGYSGYVEGVHPILPTAIGVDTNYPGYDGKVLPFSNQSQDYVYSSHCLEHIPDVTNAIQDWFRVTKVDGHIIIVVPHQWLYEKKAFLPSRFNGDHKTFFTPAILLTHVEKALRPNSYRVRLLEDGDQGFNYQIGPELHSAGAYEITLVIQRIETPSWDIV